MRFEFKFLYLWRVHSLTPQNLFVMGLFKQYGEVFKDVRTYPLRGEVVLWDTIHHHVFG